MNSLSDLTEDQIARLSDELDRYLQALEAGEPIDPEDVAKRQPDIAEAFAIYLKKLDALYGIRSELPQGNDWSAIGEADSVLQLGDFRIEQEIGRGGMGIVYEAEQLSLQRKVALKILPMAALLDARQIARFKNEAHTAGLLRHPNIVPIYSIGYENGLHYYAMQYIPGKSLDQWILEQPAVAPETDQPLNERRHSAKPAATDWQRMIGWVIDIAEALHAAHEAGVVHRDIKPSNLMLDDHGKIWVTDFGLARCQNQNSLTRSGDLIGTLRYMSPEQAGGMSALHDGRTDIYSLGATLYELLALEPAIEGEDGPHLLRLIQENDVRPLCRVVSGLPRDIGTVVSKAMAGKRDDRYETAIEFAADLRRVLAGEPTQARPATPLDLTTRWAVKHRRSVALLAVACLISLIGFASNTARLAAAKTASDHNANRASINEKLARDAVDRLGSQMAEQLADIPAASRPRRFLLSETLEYYRQFAAKAERDPYLQEDLALTYGKIGNLLDEIGQRDEAIDALCKSAETYATLVSTNPVPRLQQLWSISQNNLAQVLQRAGEIEQAAVLYASAIKTQKQLCEQKHQEADVPLATTFNNLALLLSESGHSERAEQYYQDAIECLNREPSQSLSHRMQLADIQTNYSRLLSERSSDKAVELAQRALALRIGSLDPADPTKKNSSPKLAGQTVCTLHALGTAQLAVKNYQAAIKAFEQAVEIGQQLQVRWPDHFSFQRDLAISYNHIGLANCHAGQFDEARTAFAAAIELGSRLRERFPRDAELQSLLGGMFNNLGYLHQQLGENATARQCYHQAVDAQSAAVQLAPQVVRYRQYLNKHQQNAKSVGENDSESREDAQT